MIYNSAKKSTIVNIHSFLI